MAPFHSGMNHWQRQWLNDRLHKKDQPTIPAQPTPPPAPPASNQPDEVRITVDGREFYSMARALKRGWTPRNLGEVVMAVRDGKFTVESARGGGVFSCDVSLPVTARLSGSQFYKLVSLTDDAEASGPLQIVFRIKLGEVALPNAGVKARFDP